MLRYASRAGALIDFQLTLNSFLIRFQIRRRQPADAAASAAAAAATPSTAPLRCALYFFRCDFAAAAALIFAISFSFAADAIFIRRRQRQPAAAICRPPLRLHYIADIFIYFHLRFEASYLHAIFIFIV